MDVLLGVVRGVELDDPVHRGDVKAPCRHVGAQQDALLRLAELEERGGPLGLLLVAVNVLDRNVDVVQELRVKLHRVARREEDHDLLLLHVPLEEAEQQQEPSLAGRHAVPLLDVLSGGLRPVVVHADVHGRFSERELRQVRDLAGLGGAEEAGLPVLWQQLDDLLHLLLEPDVQDAVGLVDHQALQVLKVEGGGVLEVIQQPSGRAHHQVAPPRQLLGFCLAVASAHHEPKGLGVVAAHELVTHAVGLESKLSCG
mmetsp:Transcript_86/g.336  ORF Transcript_86/g.336 Transcript_86/m.336 type:complete len:256 (-) Transcript_86:293-1060(-)